MVIFNLPTAIILSFLPYQHTQKCAVCIITYGHDTSHFFPLTTRHKNISYAYRILETQVIELRVDTNKCRDMDHNIHDHSWDLEFGTMAMEIVEEHINVNLRKIASSQNIVNKSISLFFNQDQENELELEAEIFYFSSILQLLSEPLSSYWWNVIQIEIKHTNVMWNMEQRATEFITEMYLEVIHENNGGSTTYAWNSAMIQFSGCNKFNIIIYARATNVQISLKRNIYFDLLITPYYPKFKTSHESNTEDNPFIFHQYR